ncbi:AraC family transcriptional regulator [Vallitalea okinawensis]|uniref:AraC family transcriptional regulator n=1 Tax=Vallitalea okinawensis TaxID=2078660 RepID=UPI000CFAE1B6|nr:AraC family transcriptional regulator [Vallitalea okinawensis]
MINNLNPLTFYKYGQVLFENKSIEIKTIPLIMKKITNNTLFNLHVYSEDILLVPVEGVMLIYIQDTESRLHPFLLDKPIQLKAHTSFGVIPYQKDARLHFGIPENATHQFINLNEPVKPISINPEFQVLDVHTIFYQEKEKNFVFPGEKHSFWELTYVDRGQLSTEINDRQFLLGPGELIFYTPDQFHRQESVSDDLLSFMTITFDMDINDVTFLSNKAFRINHSLKELLEQILHEYTNHTFYSNDLILCYLKEFIIKLIRTTKFTNTEMQLDTHMQNNVENNVVIQAMDYIHNHIDKKITINAIASNIPISASYLSKIFKKHTGQTIVAYINDYKLKKSKELIRESSYNLTQISMILGFSSVHYFSKQFKKQFGVTPSRYSKSIKH